MKLVDILARELKVWPEGVSAISQGGITGELYDSSFQIITPAISVTLADDRGCPQFIRDGAIITRAQWQAAVLRAEKVVEWNGEGLPPVGLTVETVRGGCACIVEILYITDRHVFMREPARNIEWLWDRKNYGTRTFRPIRTPEQIAAEDLHKIIEGGLDGKKTLTEVVDEIIANGYRKSEIVDN